MRLCQAVAFQIEVISCTWFLGRLKQKNQDFDWEEEDSIRPGPDAGPSALILAGI